MGRVLFYGTSGKTSKNQTCPLTTYLDTLDEETRRRYVTTYGLQHLYKDSDNQREATSSEDDASEVQEISNEFDVSPDGTSSITTIETPVSDSNEKNSDQLPVSARVFYEVDLDRTSELHSSLSLDIVRNQLRASSQTSRASKQLNGLEGKHPAAVCGVLCKKIITQEPILNTKAKPSLRVRLKCSTKKTEKANISSDDSKEKDNSIEIQSPENFDRSMKSSDDLPEIATSQPRKDAVSIPDNGDLLNSDDDVEDTKSLSNTSPDAQRRGRSSILSRVLPRPKQSQSNDNQEENESSVINVEEDIDSRMVEVIDQSENTEKNPIVLTEEEEEQDGEDKMGSDSLPSPLPKRKVNRPQRFLNSSPPRSTPEKSSEPRRMSLKRKAPEKEAEENKENGDDEVQSPIPAPVVQPKPVVTSTPDPVPCEICEMVNKQRPVFYFHGHQVCRVCSNFLTSTLRKLNNLHDASCIYESTCDAISRYCRNCRLHKFLRVGFDVTKFGKMRGFPQIILDLSLKALAEPAMVHAARLDRVIDYAKHLNIWRSGIESELQYASYTPIPSVTRQKPPPPKKSPSKHRRPIWHAEGKEEESLTEDNGPAENTIQVETFEFDKQRVVPLSKDVPFSCDVCSEREGELFRVDNNATVCSECLDRYKSLVTCQSSEKMPCSSGVSGCDNLSTCQACFFERCKTLVPEVAIQRSTISIPSPEKETSSSKGKSLFDSRIPGPEATALAELECVICRLIAASTKGQLNFYHLNFSPDAECEEGVDKEGVTVCESCLWNYQWRVEEARNVEEFICSNNKSCEPHKCNACLVQKCRAMIPLHKDLRLPEWIKAIMFECLSINGSKTAASADEDSERSKRVCKVKNATVPITVYEEMLPSNDVSGAKNQSRSRGRGRGRGRGKSRVGGMSKVRTKMPSQMRRRRSTASSEGKVKDNDEVDQEDDGSDLSDVDSSKNRRNHRKRRIIRMDSSDNEDGNIQGNGDDGEVDSEDQSGDGSPKNNMVTMTRILRAGGTKGPRIKQVSRHAATVFSRAKKGDTENAKRRKGKGVVNGDAKSKRRSEKGLSRDDSTDGSRRDESEHLSDANPEFNLNEVVNFAPVTPERPCKRQKSCERCIPCRRTTDCGKCRSCRQMTKFGGWGTTLKCQHRLCNDLRGTDTSRSTREAQATAWVRDLQATASLSRKSPDKFSTTKRSRQVSGQNAAQPVHKISGAPPSNTLWNTVHGLSRQIDEAHSSAIYGDQEVERIRCNLAERQATNLAWDGGVAVVTTRKYKPPGELCYLCGSAGPHKMIYCVSCSEPFHWFCLEYSDRPRSTTETAIWLCRNCKPCLLCHHTGGVLTCVSCWKGFHSRCLPGYGPAQQPNRNAWLCPGCAVCNRCGSCAADILPQSGTVALDSLPLSSRSRGWSLDPSQCAACEDGAKKGNVCPVCQRIYTDADQEMIQCSDCNLWVHALCAGLRNEDYHALSSMNPRHLSKLIFVCRRCEVNTGQQSGSNELQTSARVELRTRVRSLLHSMAAREEEMVEETRAIEEGFNTRYQPADDDDDDDLVPQVDGVVDSVSSDSLHQGSDAMVTVNSDTVPQVDGVLDSVNSDNVPQPVGVMDTVDENIVPQMNGVEEQAEAPYVKLLFPDLIDQMDTCEPWSEDDPLRYGLTFLVKHIICSLNGRSSSDLYGLQYQTYISLLTEFEAQIGQQLSWFDLQSLKRRLQKRRLIQGSFSCAGSTVGDSDDGDSDDESQPINRIIPIELHELPSSMEQMVSEAEDSDTIWMDYWYRYDRFVSKNTLRRDHDYDERDCAMCRCGGDKSLAGRLLFCGQDMWVHANCALWSNEVYETEEGSLRHVGDAVMRGGNTFCKMCKQRGATLSCCAEDVNCQRSYHFFCGIQSGCIFTVDRAFFCGPSHASAVSPEDTLSVDDLAVCRRVLIHREGFRGRKHWVSGLTASQIQITIGAMIVEWLGRIDEASDSLTSFLCPVGYRCTRMYWSLVRVNERVPYRISIRQTDIGHDPRSISHSTTAHAPASPVRAASPPLIEPVPIRPPLPEPTPQSLVKPLPEIVTMPYIPEPLDPLPVPSQTETLADRLQRISREMKASKRTPLFEALQPPSMSDVHPNTSYRPEPVPRTNARKSRPTPRNHCEDSDDEHSPMRQYPVPVAPQQLNRPMITSVCSLADGERDESEQTETPLSAISPPQQHVPSIWKTPTNSSQRPTARIIPSCERPQRAERATVGMPKRPNPEPVQGPETKRLRLTSPSQEPANKPTNKLVVTRRVTNGKTIYVCLTNNGLTAPPPAAGVQKIIHPVQTGLLGNNNIKRIDPVRVVPKQQMMANTGALSSKIDKVLDRVLINPPQLDGCMDEDDNKSAIKDPPKRKTRWIEERDKKDYLKNYLANLPNSNARRKKSTGDCPEQHLAAISRAKRKHDERRYRKATADVQENFWLSFTVENYDLSQKVSNMSPRLSWKQITSRVKDLRYNSGWRHPYIFGVDGWSQLGLTHRILAYIIEQMEGAYLAYRHRFIYHRKKIEDLRQLNAPPVPCKRGCARAEPYPKEAWRLHETFSFLLCSVNNSGTSLAPSQPGISIDEDPSISNPAKLQSFAPLVSRLRQLSCRRGRDVEVFRSPIHCRGLFALHSFNKDEMITEYLGEVIRSIVCEERERKYQEAHVDCFMFRIDSESVIDATMKGNAARFINHSCNPNCYSRVITMPDATKHIVILAQRDIQRGEELTYDYKFPAEDDKIPCHCAAQNCRRFLN